MKRIRFQGKLYVLVGETEGAIATDEQYQKGLCSYAHLFPDGSVKRYGEVIGNRSEIEFLGDVMVAVDFAAFAHGMATDSNWKR